MEILKRKIEAEIEEHNTTKENTIVMSASLIDGERLSCRWHKKDDMNNDILVNFTKEETEKILKLRRRDC